MLKASAFVIRHEYIFALLCILNVNMGALDLSRPEGSDGSSYKSAEAYRADALLRYYLAHDILDLRNSTCWVFV